METSLKGSQVKIKEVILDTYYIDGDFVDDEQAQISVKDLTVLRGFGIFDFLITYNKRPFYLKEHVQRFENSARKIGLKLGHTNEEIVDIVNKTIEKNSHHKESSIRIIYTGGVSPDGVTPQGNGILMVMVTPKHNLPDWWYEDGAKIVTVNIERFIPASKSTNYLTAVFAQQQAREQDGIEAVYVDKENRVLEGTASTFFAFKDKTLITPPDSILLGITREVVINLVKGLYNLEMRHIDKSELENMDEVFISASNKEIVPIIKINDMIVGSGKPGDKTRHIMRLFKEYTDSYGKGLVS